MAEENTIWTVPAPLSTLEVQVDDEALITLRRHGNPEGHRLLLCHGNGLAIDMYYPFWSLLLDEFDVIVHDLRNHGWNKVTSSREHTMVNFSRDHDFILDAIDDHYGEKPTTGVYHSVSCLASLISPSKGSRNAALVLLDPPLCKPGTSYEEFDLAATRTAERARRRTFHFKSREAFTELLSYSPAFYRTVPGTLDLISRATLRKCANEEGFELRCPPEYESQIVDFASPYAVLVDFAKFHCPIKVIGADPTLPYSYLPTLDLSDIMHVDYDFLPNATHFLPIEQPETCAHEVRNYIAEVVG
jgi:pimeloyl-ACP methyl ester carboxylesterase